MGTGSFLGEVAAGVGADSPPPSTAEGPRKRIELYLFST